MDLRAVVAITLLLIVPVFVSGQQLPDTTFLPVFDDLAYPGSTGPTVIIDEAHNNFHTMSDRYWVFAETLRRDGYRVGPGTEIFSRAWLDTTDVVVISNALHESNVEDWSLPTPSAFSSEEISELKAWIEDGGSLFFIADHMPFPGAGQELAEALGFEFSNGYAVDTTRQGPDVFSRANGRLHSHAITDGSNETDRIDSVASFTGQAFRAGVPCDPILMLDSSFAMFLCEEAGQIDEDTPVHSVSGWLHGAVANLGKGRVAIFGEAAMYTAQVAHTDDGEIKFGMSQPEASQNLRFLRNLMQWLSRDTVPPAPIFDLR